jgi:hypothetical protein
MEQNMLQRLIDERNITNDATITAYTHADERLQKLHSHADYWKRSELGMKKLFEKCEYSDSTKMQMLNLLIMVRRLELRPVASLEGMRNKLRKEIEAETKKNLPLLDLPDYDAYFGELCPSDPQRYIVNSLIQIFGLRNLDMMMEFVKFKRGDQLPNFNRNYMIIQSRDVLMEIRDYKTRVAYGVKKLRITKKQHPQLVRCINDYVKAGHKFLLSKKNGDEIKKTSLHSHIRILTNGHGSGILFKSVINYHRTHAHLNKLAELSKSRGTSLSVICSSYNVEKE